MLLKRFKVLDSNMKIGKLDIKKAYFGSKELTSKNAFVGEVPVFPGCKNYLTFRAKQANSTVGLARKGIFHKLWYSYDTAHWNEFDISITLTLENVDDEVYIGGEVWGEGNDQYNSYTKFLIDSNSKIELEGKVASLWNHEDAVLPSGASIRDQIGMGTFSGCEGLISAENLEFPEELQPSCFFQFFYKCTGLVTPPKVLPAHTLEYCCYTFMFSGCSSLATAPEILARKAWDASNNAMMGMFEDCISLQESPILKIASLSQTSSLTIYENMFKGCTALNKVTCYAVEGLDECTDWLQNVSPTGTFIMHPFADPNNPEPSEKWTLGSPSGVPQGWTVQIDYPGLKFKALENNSSIGFDGAIQEIELRYSTDNCITWSSKWSVINPISLQQGETICFRGNNQDGLLDPVHYDHYSQFTTSTGKFEVSGNIMSLLDDGRCEMLEIPCDYCFQRLFEDAKITTAPELPAKILKNWCYYEMFYGCADLITAPELPATNLAERCYNSMFLSCTSLTTAPELPARELTEGCYGSMFMGCHSLTKAPDLLAKVVPDWAYSRMFCLCIKLNYIKCLAKEFGDSSTEDWLSDVASQGTFVQDPDVEWHIGDDGIPTSWVWKGLRFKSTGVSTIGFVLQVAHPDQHDWWVNLQYSLDQGETWIQMDNHEPYGPTTYDTITLQDGKEVWFKGTNETTASASQWGNHHGQFVMTGSIEASGNIASILDNGLCTKIDLGGWLGIAHLFEGCAALKSIPEIPFISFSLGAYSYLFKDCIGLTTLNGLKLHVTTLSNHCYFSMFEGCSNLMEAPDLPATEAEYNCYTAMFQGCTSLRHAPKINLRNIKTGSLTHMFSGCALIDKIECDIAEGWDNEAAYPATYEWLKGVSPTGTFIKHAAAEGWELNSPNGIPSGWTVQSQEYEGLKFKAVGGSSNVEIQHSHDNIADIKYSIDYGETWNEFNYSTQQDLTIGSVTIQENQEIWFKGDNPNGFSNRTGSGYNSNFKLTGSYIEASGNIMSLIDNGRCETLIIPNQKCFQSLFHQCYALVTPPEFPAITLTEYCYSNTFTGCSRLLQIPNIPAIEIPGGALQGMFLNCASLEEAELPNIERLLGDWAFSVMFYGCSRLKRVSVPKLTYFGNYSLSRWLEGVASTGTFIKHRHVHYDRGISGIPEGWTNIPYKGLTFKAVEDSTIAMNIIDPVDLWYSLDQGETWTDWSDGRQISLKAGEEMCVKGNNPNGFTRSPRNYKGNQFIMTGLISASGNVMSLLDNGECISMIIPVRTCFYGIFQDCTSLLTPPDLPATTLSETCYAYMFAGCAALIKAPQLPSIYLENYCYYSMFEECKSLTEAPDLPAEALHYGCYHSMFAGCTCLVKAPNFPELSANSFSMQYMFKNCVSLLTIPKFTFSYLNREQGIFSGIFEGCSSLRRIEWSVLLYNDNWTNYLFKDCKNLNYIKCLVDAPLFEGIGKPFIGSSQTGTFVKKRGVEWPIGENGIPEGWTIIEVDE